MHSPLSVCMFYNYLSAIFNLFIIQLLFHKTLKIDGNKTASANTNDPLPRQQKQSTHTPTVTNTYTYQVFRLEVVFLGESDTAVCVNALLTQPLVTVATEPLHLQTFATCCARLQINSVHFRELDTPMCKNTFCAQPILAVLTKRRCWNRFVTD